MVFNSASDGSEPSLWTLDDFCGKVSWIKKFNFEAGLRIVILFFGWWSVCWKINNHEYIFYDYRKKVTNLYLAASLGQIWSFVK